MVYMEFEMINSSDTNNGIKLLVQKCREQFRISENLEHYSEGKYREAERKYVKFCLRGKTKKIISFEKLQ